MSVHSEQWKSIPGFDGYEVCACGRVRSYRLDGHSNARRTKPRTLRPWAQDGYQYVNLSIGARAIKKRVHHLVLLAFVSPCPEGHEGAHKNGDRADNRLENLAWTTHGENEEHKLAHGTRFRGTGHPLAKLTEQSVRDLRADRALGLTWDALSKKYGVAATTARDACLGVKWSHVQ